MKKRLKILFLTLALAGCMTLPAFAQPAETGNATTYTYTLDANGGWIRTQDAYLTGEVLFLNEPLTLPEDMTVRNGSLYVADTGASRVLQLMLKTGETKVFGAGLLEQPTGIFAAEDGSIYVADPKKEAVFHFGPEGDLLHTYGRPKTNTFGKTAVYKPTKVAVDRNGILSIVSPGAYDGLVQLGPDGEFLGYFGYNSIPMSLLELFQDRFFTEAQKAQLFHKLPLSFYNLAINPQGVIYTVTQGTDESAVKAHNVTGVNLLPEDLPGEKNFADVAIGPDGQILAVSETGLVYEYDSDGALLFSFGGRAAISERNGLVTVASSIAVDENAQLYVLDGERGLVHTYLSTDFADRLHGAIRQYRSGQYKTCMENLDLLLGQVGNVKIVYDYMGKNAYQLGNFDDAALYYRNAGNRQGYSDAFWEIRSKSMNILVPAIFLLLIVSALLGFAHSAYRKKHPKAEKVGKKPKKDLRIWSDFCFSVSFLRHPIDGYEEVRIGRRGNAVTASLLYLLGFIVFAADFALRGFAFAANNLEDTSPFYVVLMYLLPVGLFVISSYMVSAINDGKGTFRQMYIGMAYALIPYLILIPCVTVLTHVLSLNESFLVVLGSVIAYVWTASLIVISLRELHDYEFRQAFVNILLALFLMIVIIFVCSIVAMFWDRIINMLVSIVKEVNYRAKV